MALTRSQVDKFNSATQEIGDDLADWEARVGQSDSDVKKTRSAWRELRQLISQANVELDRDGSTSVTLRMVEGPANRAEAALDDLSDRFGKR